MKTINTSDFHPISTPLRSRLAFTTWGLATALAVATLLLPSVGQAGGVVTNCTEVALRAAMVGGGTVTFACDGTISLTNVIGITNPGPATVLDGTGHQISLTSPHGVFYVGTNSHLTVANVAIVNSRAVSVGTNPPALLSGAGIFNDGGVVALQRVTFQGNGAASGGAVLNQASGTLNATNCTFIGNVAGPNLQVAPKWDGPGTGGAILNQSGQMNLQACLFMGNRAAGGSGTLGAVGGNPSGGYDGCGGAIANCGSLFVGSCTFSGNAASGGTGDDYIGPYTTGGAAYGGAIWGSSGLVAIASSSFFSNNVTGGKGGIGRSSDPGNPFGFNGGPGANGGWAYGAAVEANASAVNSTFAWNTAIAGAGGQGGYGGYGSHMYGVPPGNGGNGGAGGSASGAVSGVSLTNCTIAFNFATNGGGGAGGFGGTWYDGSGPPGATGDSGGSGSANGGITGCICIDTLLASNAPNGNCYGTIVDRGHNLSSDASCPFSNAGLTNSDAKLAALANNGGPTLTIALLPGSPAIDAGDTSLAPATDQRGYPRPAGVAADIGAFEYGSVMPSLAVSRSGTTLNLFATGNSNQPCRLLVSSNLLDWAPIATNQIGSDGTFLFHDNCASGGACRFYRLVMP